MNIIGPTYPLILDPSTAVMDSTKLNAFATCQRKYFYEYVLGWQRPSNHLVFGQAVHAAMEVLLDMGISGEAAQLAYDAFLKVYSETYSEDEWDDYWPKTPARFGKMLLAYCERYIGTDTQFEVVEFEGKKLIEIAGTLLISDKHAIAFRMDSVLRDIERRRIFSREHKTGSSVYGFKENFEFSFQVNMYLYVLYMLFEEHEVEGIEINGMIFKKTKDGGPAEKKEGYSSHFEFMRPMIYRRPQDIANWLHHANTLCDEVERQFMILSEVDSASNRHMQSFMMNLTACQNYGGCPFKVQCMMGNNPLQEMSYGIPIGFQQHFWNPLEEESNINMNIDQGGKVDVQDARGIQEGD